MNEGLLRIFKGLWFMIGLITYVNCIHSENAIGIYIGLFILCLWCFFVMEGKK